MRRHKTKEVAIGRVKIGGSNVVAIQSMTKTFTHDVKKTVEQIKKLEDAGCQIVRCAVADAKDAAAIVGIKRRINIPLVADIHFDHRLAIAAVQAGADKIRINPGNIGDAGKLHAVVNACKQMGAPIRIGVNAGSLEKDILKKFRKPSARALVESAMKNIRVLEKMDFRDIVVSIKSADVTDTIEAYRMLAKKTDYPLHVGVTEAGIATSGIIKSSVGIGALLAEGIGDTIRVSLTGDPVNEVIVAREILKSLGRIKYGVDIISCPTCGRCRIDVERIAGAVARETMQVKKPVKIAIMGCAVNGPGEARDADIGLAGGDGVGLIFRKGKIVKKVDESRMIGEIIREVRRLK